MFKALFFSIILITSTVWGFYPVSENSQVLFDSLKGAEKFNTEFLESQIKSLNEYSGSAANYEVRMKKIPRVEGQPLSEWVPIIDENSRKLVLELRMTDEGLKSPLIISEELIRLNQIMQQSFSHPYEWAETVSNAKAGSIRATEKLARMDVQAAMEVKGWIEANPGFYPEGIDTQKLDEWSKARLSEAQTRYKPIANAAKIELQRLENEWAKMRPVFTNLEKQEKKFNHLVMANDRVGARKMLETYIPWVLMEPSEQSAWRAWLDAMEKPDLSRRELVFRGMDGYPVLRTPGSDKVGMFSSVLAMNQGNYTRRLRSLTTSREKIGRVDNYEVETDKEKFPKDEPSLIDQMKRHANDPVSSPFLSVSDHSIAESFGSRERIALLVDERRLVPNALAFAYGERERLIPLVIFPDEVVHYQGKASDGITNIDNEQFIAKVTEALGRPVTPAELNAGNNGGLDEPEFNKRGFDRLSTIFLNPAGASIQGEVCVVGSSCGCIRKALDTLLATP